MQTRGILITSVFLGMAVLAGVASLRLARVQSVSLARTVPADGRFHPIARLHRRLGLRIHDLDVSVSGTDPSHILTQSEPSGALQVLYRAPIRGGDAELHLRYGRAQRALRLSSATEWIDTLGDGLPDALRLHDAEDRVRFRRWFTALADRAASLPYRDLPPEITDCSSLLRYSYRLALMRHDDRWYKQFPPGVMPVLPSVKQWTYPETPLGPALFRITPPAQMPKLAEFAQFADAKTLYSRNSFRLGRDVRIARPGDLLFFHQLEENSQYHSMIVTGDGGAWVVYHTGPSGTGATRTHGEMRRARVADLLQHPDPRWHPTADNPNFLGVYRWNLLRED